MKKILTDISAGPLSQPLLPVKNPFIYFIDFFSSVRLALVLLIVLAAVSITGTIIPQNLAVSEYERLYDPRLYFFLDFFDLTDMYHSWWFNTLLGLLMLNLITCSIKRFPRTLKLARTISGERAGPGFLRKQSVTREFVLPHQFQETRSLIHRTLRRNFARPREVESSWGILFLSHRRAYARFGVYFIHLSLLIIMAGSLVGGYGGFKARLNLIEGQTSGRVSTRHDEAQIDLPFSLRLDRFVLKLYPNGSPKEYRSDLTIFEQGREVRKASVRVNHPLTYKGITIFQSSYGKTLSAPLGLRLVRKTDLKLFQMAVSRGRLYDLPDNYGTIQIMNFSENLMRSGPAVGLIINPKEGKRYIRWAFKDRPVNLPREAGLFTYDLTSYELSYYTGLQANKDPGVWLVWLGCGLLIAGCFITFFVSHQKLYAGLIEEGEGTRVIMAGSSHRNPESFEAKFNRLIKTIQQAQPKIQE
ncbi:MAG: cytochrome c biogenesis protein ResB [Deltaproteobacteria bacterium]|nr:cytochrome c biogenesis protein ResB [Deltaproteobacteria bacterium]